MQTCPQCNTSNRDGAKFCASCGNPFETQAPAQAEARPACPSCGAENEVGAKFCEACGAALQQTPAPPSEPEPASEPPVGAEPAPSPPESQAEPSTPPAAQPQAPAGEPATLACPACGTENDSDAKFCGACGADLQQATAPSADAQPAPQPASTPPAQPPAKAEPVSEAVPATPSTGPAECPSCGYVVHYCPSCGTPMQTDAQPSDHPNPQQHQVADTQ